MAIRKILRKRGVKEATGLQDSQIYELMARGEFPRPVKLSAQAVGWFEDEVIAWQEKRPRTARGTAPRNRKRQPAPEAA
jgi:prophage regulatory protein